MRPIAFARLIGVVAIAGVAWAVSAGCQVALRADGADVECDLPENTPCPGSDTLVCLGGVCRPPPACQPKNEICNGLDDNCDGQVDEGFDKDGDGFFVCGKFDDQGAPVPNTIDCNDNDPKIHPGAAEVCDGVDNNCDGRIDEAPNDCTQQGMECWSDQKSCVQQGDCRLHGCTTGGCDATTGQCTGSDCVQNPALCTSGQQCDPRLRTCVDVAGAGDPCGQGITCAADLRCIDTYVVGSICTVPCCSSDECPAGLLCKYATNGAATCVPAKNLGLTLGDNAAHTSCSAGSDCRSGVCASGKCVDGCCGSTSCGSNGTCTLKTDNQFLCRDGYSGGGNYGDACSGPTDCKDGACLDLGGGFGFCTQRCCSSSDCPDKRDHCELATSGSNPVQICVDFEFNPDVGNLKGGDPCGTGNDCRSGTCTGGHCVDLCCTDADCSGGYVCMPSFNGTYATMTCQPP